MSRVWIDDITMYCNDQPFDAALTKLMELSGAWDTLLLHGGWLSGARSVQSSTFSAVGSIHPVQWAKT
jgi:hypothetical protein